MIARRERERVIGVLTNGATWRQSCGDDHSMMLNRGSRWCFDGEMVPGVRCRDWSRMGVVDNGDALIMPFIGL
jgi:hypothetical protein